MRPFLLQSLGTLLLYIGLAVFYSLRCSRPFAVHEPVLWPTLIALVVLLFCMLKQVVAGRVPTKAIVWVGIAMALAAVAIRPFHSTDVYGYINRGWQQAHYGLNPYVYTIDTIRHWHDDPMLTNHWVNNPSPYGFIYLLIAKGLSIVGAALGAPDKGGLLWWFKGTNVLVHLATAFLIWLGVTRWAKSSEAVKEEPHPETSSIDPKFANVQQPQKSSFFSLACPLWLQPRLALAAYLFNPLILLHGLANGHNDLWMGFFLTLTAYFSLIGAWLWVLPALTASILVKYGSIVLVPFAMLFILKQKRGLQILLGGIGLSALIGLISGIPYLPDWSHFHLKEIGRNALVSHSSLHSFWFASWKTLVEIHGHTTKEQREVVREGLAKVLTGSFALFYIGLLFKRFRQRDYSPLLWQQDAVLILIVLIGLISLKFYAWYIGIFFSMSFLLPLTDWRRRFIWAFSLMQLMSLTIVGQAHILNFALMTAVPWGAVALPGLGLKKWQQTSVIIGVLGSGILLAAILGLRH